jgi:hypothetical protein
MLGAGKRTRVALSLVCVLVLVTTATAHLVHTSQSHRQHRKNTSELACALCAFSVRTTALTTFAVPALVLLASLRLQKAPSFRADGSLTLPLSRAPPAGI